MMDRVYGQIPAPFRSEEEFQRIFNECLESRPNAPEEVSKSWKGYHKAQEQYLAALTEYDFRYGFECGWNAALKGGE